MDKLFAMGFRKEIKAFATSDKCNGPLGVVLLSLGATAKQPDIEKHIELLRSLFESDFTMGVKQFEQGFLELNVLFDLQLASRDCVHQWARWEATKMNCLWDYSYRSAMRAGTSRCPAVNDLLRILADKHEITSAPECVDVEEMESDLEEILPECPLTPQQDTACVDISDSNDDGEETQPGWSLEVPGMDALMADGGADEMLALADNVMDCKGQKLARQQDRASRRRQQKSGNKQPKTKSPMKKTKITRITKAKGKITKTTKAKTKIAEVTSATPTKKASLERLDRPDFFVRKLGKQPALIEFWRDWIPEGEPCVCKVERKREVGRDFYQVLRYISPGKKQSLVCLSVLQFGDKMGRRLATSLQDMAEAGFSKDQIQKQKDKWASILKNRSFNAD